MSVDLIGLPGQLTDSQRPVRPDGAAFVDLNQIRELGYRWLSYQLVNGDNVTGINIQPARDAGLSAGVWGVVYDQADFFPFGVRLGEEAAAQLAEHVIVDAEECAKGTHATAGMRPVIDGLRAGGWTGPVHLTTLGAPANALPYGPNNYEIDIASFLATGGGVLPQAYYQSYDDYRPDLCVDYWHAVGVPRTRINVMIGLFVEAGSAKEQRIDGDEWTWLLQDAGIAQNFCVYMIQHGTDQDWQGLMPLSQPPPPQPEPAPEPTPPHEESAMEQIGPDHGITAFINWLQQQPGAPTRSANYDPAKPATWPWPERLERTLNLELQDYEHRAKETTSYAPSATS